MQRLHVQSGNMDLHENGRAAKQPASHLAQTGSIPQRATGEGLSYKPVSPVIKTPEE
jgi:molybdenum-dependent DNA-binding transcriptional regulator ModE